MAYPLASTTLNVGVLQTNSFVWEKKIKKKKQRGHQIPDHCSFDWWWRYSTVKPQLRRFTLTHYLNRKAVWNSTCEQINIWSDMCKHYWGKTIKRGWLVKKGSITCYKYTQSVHLILILVADPVRVVKKISSSRRIRESNRHRGPEAPHQARDLGAAQAPTRGQGHRPVRGPGGEDPRSKTDLRFSCLLKLALLSLEQC